MCRSAACYAVGLTRRHGRVQAELRTDSPAIRDSLESLSTFYGPQNNTVESRRSLRAGIEAEGLRLADSFITAFSGLEDVSGLSATTAAVRVFGAHDVACALCTAFQQVVLANRGAGRGLCTRQWSAAADRRTHSRLPRHHTTHAVEAVRQCGHSRALAFAQLIEMTPHRRELAEQAALVAGFLDRFQLSDEEAAAIHTLPLERDGGARFFAALERVQNIRKECQTLLEEGSHSAGCVPQCDARPPVLALGSCLVCQAGDL